MTDKYNPNWIGLPDEVLRLQRKLADLPLVPLDKRLRNRRDKITKELLQKATEQHCVDRIDLLAGWI